jgi:hypothetical protein
MRTNNSNATVKAANSRLHRLHAYYGRYTPTVYTSSYQRRYPVLRSRGANKVVSK